MSTSNDLPYFVGQQKAFISSELNSTLLTLFLFGIYTGLFPVTIYLYGISSSENPTSWLLKAFTLYIVQKENRTPARDRIIIGSTAALYCLTALNTVMNWLYTNILFGTHGATRLKMFEEIASPDVPLGEKIIEDLTVFAVFLFADGLLVWRCFHSCGSSFRRSLLPITLLVVETVLALTAMVYRFFMYAKPDFETIQTVQIFERLSAAAFVTVVATSLVSTGLICLQIWRHTKLSTQSRKRYRIIVSALIESSAMYTVTVLFLAITDFASTGKIEGSFTVSLISIFVQAASQVVSGLAPTLMIARLVVSASQDDTEVSSVPLPFDLVSRASHSTHDDVANESSTDVEMQQSGSIGVGKQDDEEIQAVLRINYVS